MMSERASRSWGAVAEQATGRLARVCPLVIFGALSGSVGAEAAKRA